MGNIFSNSKTGQGGGIAAAIAAEQHLTQQQWTALAQGDIFGAVGAVAGPQLKQKQRTAQATKTVMAMNGPGMTTIPRGTGVMPGREAALSNAPASDTQFNQPPSFKR